MQTCRDLVHCAYTREELHACLNYKTFARTQNSDLQDTFPAAKSPRHKHQPPTNSAATESSLRALQLRQLLLLLCLPQSWPCCLQQHIISPCPCCHNVRQVRNSITQQYQPLPLTAAVTAAAAAASSCWGALGWIWVQSRQTLQRTHNNAMLQVCLNHVSSWSSNAVHYRNKGIVARCRWLV